MLSQLFVYFTRIWILDTWERSMRVRAKLAITDCDAIDTLQRIGSAG